MKEDFMDQQSDETFESEASFMVDAEDHAILMHRDAHFGGHFDTMIHYYEEGGKGVMSEFELRRIRELALLEIDAEQDLASCLLSGAEAEKVAAALKAYKVLRTLYEKSNDKDLLPRLIADLILSEEELPQAEIAAIVAQKGAIVPHLIELLRSATYYDPLFPGYGSAPTLAAHCLGLIGDKRAMFSLFEAIGEENFFAEDYLLDALKLIGTPAKEFLLKVVQTEPLNFDNERAAIALVRFKDDPEVACCCLQQLLKPHVWKDATTALHLILACEALADPEQQRQFAALTTTPTFPKILARDVAIVSQAHQKMR
jgi:hypothetical protein